MQAEIIAVGTELLSFSRTETNSLFLASRLIPLGIPIVRKYVVADRDSLIRETLDAALQSSDIILLTGGLGPTTDDVTRESVAGLLQRPLREDPELIDLLRRRYARYRLKLHENSRRQALVPEGAEILENPMGTAPGLFLRVGSRMVFLLPGPPRELRPMVDNHVLPLLHQFLPLVASPMRQLKIAGEAESQVDARIAGIYQRYEDVETTILSSPGVVSLYFVWRSESETVKASESLDRLVAEIREELGRAVFTEREESLSEVLGRMLRAGRLSLATAESCTGGLLSKSLTDVPGSSEYFLGGVVSYADSVKVGLLGVDAAAIREHGAVSALVAEQMAVGVSGRLSSDIGVAVTGIAGPGGGSAEKPVGTVFLGLYRAGARKTKRLFLPGDREAIRVRTSQLALDWLRRELP